MWNESRLKDQTLHYVKWIQGEEEKVCWPEIRLVFSWGKQRSKKSHFQTYFQTRNLLISALFDPLLPHNFHRLRNFFKGFYPLWTHADVDPFHSIMKFGLASAPFLGPQSLIRVKKAPLLSIRTNKKKFPVALLFCNVFLGRPPWISGWIFYGVKGSCSVLFFTL